MHGGQLLRARTLGLRIATIVIYLPQHLVNLDQVSSSALFLTALLVGGRLLVGRAKPARLTPPQAVVAIALTPTRVLLLPKESARFRQLNRPFMAT